MRTLHALLTMFFAPGCADRLIHRTILEIDGANTPEYNVHFYFDPHYCSMRIPKTS